MSLALGRDSGPVSAHADGDHVGLAAASPEAFEAIRSRLIDAGASDGTINDFGTAQSIFFRDPDGLEGEVLLPKP